MKISRTKRKAVAPVLATLMMIAVAVAMSVIIFVWAQGFLSQTSSAAGGQQSQQNIAAQSSISIDSATFSVGSGGSVTMVVRNVGSVTETLGSLLVQGSPSNTNGNGFTASGICTTFTASPSGCSGVTGATVSASVMSGDLKKGDADVITFTFGTTGGNYLADGDIINIKVATTAGTFATQQYTVP